MPALCLVSQQTRQPENGFRNVIIMSAMSIAQEPLIDHAAMRAKEAKESGLKPTPLRDTLGRSHAWGDRNWETRVHQHYAAAPYWA